MAPRLQRRPGLLEQLDALAAAPGQHVGVAERGHDVRRERSDARVPAQRHGALENRHRIGQPPLDGVGVSERSQREHESVVVVQRLRGAHAAGAVGLRLLEPALLGQERGEPALGEDQRQPVQPQLLARGRAAQRVDHASEVVLRLGEIADTEARRADVERGRRQEREVTERLGDIGGVFEQRQRLAGAPGDPQILPGLGREECRSAGVTEFPRRCLRLPQRPKTAVELAQCIRRRVQGQPDVDAQLQRRP